MIKLLWRAWSACLLAVLVLPLQSCGRTPLGGASIHGTVLNIQGEPLPGVVVTLVDHDKQALTNALGEYSLPARSGDLTLQFMKSGYTSGSLTIANVGLGSVAANPVSLWCLPQTSGLFLFENYRYRRATAFKPKPFARDDGSVVYGVGKLRGVEETLAPQPLLMCYKMPSYDAKLCRLTSIEAASPESPGSKSKVWVFEKSLPLTMLPVDEPDRVLWEVRLIEPLEPGIYAIHWGALDGYTSTDERVFVFAIASESGESSVPAEQTDAPRKSEPEAPAPAPAGVPDEDIPDEAPDEAQDGAAPTPASAPTPAQ